jgi:hypothetical protein
MPAQVDQTRVASLTAVRGLLTEYPADMSGTPVSTGSELAHSLGGSREGDRRSG